MQLVKGVKSTEINVTQMLHVLIQLGASPVHVTKDTVEMDSPVLVNAASYKGSLFLMQKSHIATCNCKLIPMYTSWNICTPRTATVM